MPTTLVTGAPYEYSPGSIADCRNNFKGADGWHYVIYYHAAGLHYKSSQDGITWGAEQDIIAVGAVWFSIFTDGNTVVVFYQTGIESTVNNTAQFNSKKGLAALGTITWNAAVKICDFGGYFRCVSCSKGDAAVYAIVFGGYFCAPWAPAGFACAIYTTPDLEVWSLSIYDTDASDSGYYAFASICKNPAVLGGFIYATSKRAETSVRYRLFDGANWAASVEIANMKTALNAAAVELEYDPANAIAHLLCKNQVIGGDSTVKYVLFDGTNWSTPLTLIASCTYSSACLQTTYGLFVFYSKTDGKICYKVQNPKTLTWGGETLWQLGETGPTYLKSAKNGIGIFNEPEIGVNWRGSWYSSIRYQSLLVTPATGPGEGQWAAIVNLPPKKLLNAVQAYVNVKNQSHKELLT